MELDLWEGQFNLSSLQGLQGLTDEEYEDYSRGATCWGGDSVVTMGTVQQLQEEVGELQEEHFTDQKKYHSVKQDNSELVKKIFILEELLRDSELSHIQTKKQEENRIKELEGKLSLVRKKNEDFAARIEYLEEENTSLAQKSKEQDKTVSNLISENRELGVKISDLEVENTEQKQELQQNKLYFVEEDRCVYEQIPHSLSRLEQSETDSGCHIQDSDDMVSDLQGRLTEMEAEIRVLRDQKSCVRQNGQIWTDKSLAEEIEDTTSQERKSLEDEILELKNNLMSQEEVNNQLQSYIDAVILNIMDKNPELLEVQKKF